MKINRIEIAGFGPYRHPQVVDFDAYADDGIFLISGRTGAGKSSILDAICFALYNAVPRYDGTEKQLRSHHCDHGDPSTVTLDFTIGERQYRVTRSPDYERRALRGGGTTTQKATATLERREGDAWHGIAARPVDVGHELSTILGLSKDQFLQVILLAQNRFQEFLHAKSEDRQALLQALFGTERFAHYEAAIVERWRALEARLGTARDQLDRDAERATELLAGIHGTEPAPAEGDLLAWFAQGLAVLEQHLAEASRAAEVAQTRLDQDSAAHQALSERRAQQQRRDDALAAQRRLAAEAPAIERQRADLAAAIRAAAVAATLTARDSAERALANARRDEDHARDAYADTGEERDIDAEHHDARIDEHSRTLGALENALKEEAELPALEERLTALDTDVAAHCAALAAIDADLEAHPARQAELAAQQKDAAVEASRLGDARASLDRLQQRRDAAREAAALLDQLEKAQQRERDASSAHLTAAARHDELLQRRFHGYAAELADRLVAGEPCEVCGSAEHPAPATPAGDAVSEHDLEQAREQLDHRRSELDVASARVRELSADHAAARARAGEATLETVESQLAAAEQAVVAAENAAATLDTLAQAQRVLEEQRERRTAERREKAEALTAAETEQVQLRGSIDTIRVRLARERAEYESVAARAEALRTHIALARRLGDAIRAVAERRAALDDATTRLEHALTEHGFATATEASDAQLSEPRRQELDAEIRRHENAVAVVAATLDDAAIRDLPEESIDLSAAEETLAASREAHAAAVEARTRAGDRHDDYARLLDAVQQRHADTAALRAECDDIASLAQAVQGGGANTRRMRLETYVLAAQLEEIVAAANARLHAMTSGRYELQHDDSVQYRKTKSGLGLAILDQHTGRARATHSLSGGETFLASLALALGLAEVVTAQSGGITLDTLFVDEGFGSLDADTLGIAMSTLDSLRAGGRTIGLISHVDAMKEQIHATLDITVTDGGWSEIRQRA